MNRQLVAAVRKNPALLIYIIPRMLIGAHEYYFRVRPELKRREL